MRSAMFGLLAMVAALASSPEAEARNYRPYSVNGPVEQCDGLASAQWAAQYPCWAARAFSGGIGGDGGASGGGC